MEDEGRDVKLKGNVFIANYRKDSCFADFEFRYRLLRLLVWLRVVAVEERRSVGIITYLRRIAELETGRRPGKT